MKEAEYRQFIDEYAVPIITQDDIYDLLDVVLPLLDDYESPEAGDEIKRTLATLISYAEI